MNDFRIIEPEVAGGLGPGTVLDSSALPPRVEKLHYEFEGWLGDELLTTTPCFIVTLPLKDTLVQLGGTGYFFEQVTVSKSRLFQERRPEITLPEFAWWRVNGVPGIDDAGLTERAALVVSEKLLTALRKHNISNCRIRKKPFGPIGL